jgi:outer membrane protein assembly factor BamB
MVQVGNVATMPVLAGQDEHLYGFSPTGPLHWRTQVPGHVLGSPVFDRYGHIYVGVSQAPRGLEPRGLLVCLDGNSHKLRWEYRAAGLVYVPHDDADSQTASCDEPWEVTYANGDVDAYEAVC